MLTDAQCRNAICPTDKKRERFSDAGGLYLELSPAGSKRWFLKYRAAGVEKRLALGSYPDVGLTARKAREAAKLQKSEGRDPVQARKIEKLKSTIPDADTFRVTALEWFDKNQTRWSRHNYAIREKRNLEKDLFPYFSARRISEIEAIELLAAIRRSSGQSAYVSGGLKPKKSGDGKWRRKLATEFGGHLWRRILAVESGVHRAPIDRAPHGALSIGVGSSSLFRTASPDHSHQVTQGYPNRLD